jgi:hypothetical protein
MPTPDEPRSAPSKTQVLVASVVTLAVVAMVVLHLTGVIGPG